MWVVIEKVNLFYLFTLLSTSTVHRILSGFSAKKASKQSHTADSHHRVTKTIKIIHNDKTLCYTALPFIAQIIINP